ncbi:hypothetical protein HNP55_002223 [Paucibacter oligotrophus]|uniref:Uncharacterized protein n=1 Tax=Roseateles oligotrophus TaxID=1769250 RepID=A0A840L686_9BURK|nr:hypothetical protein [Roseateles oligotrophus]MBB4843700.1 hypothetical protein [Roseateles oligotrophus]
MIIPLHLIAQPQDSAAAFFDLRESVALDARVSVGGYEVDPALRPQAGFDLGLTVVAPANPADLQRLQVLMAAEGLSLQPTRMMYDRLYACERLAQGHASANPALRELAMQLFNSYQQAGEWIGLVH